MLLLQHIHFSLFHMQIQGSWEKKLIEKVMHNSYWKQHKRSVEKDDSSDSSTPKRKCGRPSTSQVLTRYPPLRDTGEDETASERNRQQLQQELERDRPRKETILQGKLLQLGVLRSLTKPKKYLLPPFSLSTMRLKNPMWYVS